MGTGDSLMLAVWQEVCRHIEIQESTERIAALLVNRLPLQGVLVREVDAARACVETVARGPADFSASAAEGRSSVAAESSRAVVAWCRSGRVARLTVGQELAPAAELMLGGRLDAEAIVGPMLLDSGRCGALILLAQPGRAFADDDLPLAAALVEAFSAALDNDHRLREIAALREAAEAEKQSLLTRLGRKQLGDTIVGAESGLKAVMERVQLVARSDVPVLIFGETGSGKELVARAIHQRSPRAARPFLRVNCGAIPGELVDSQLFGHERGAFTGAVEMRRGWFERADGGTLLLDEIGELPLAAQVRLLRIAQDGWLERVGGHQPISVDVRIVAATHRDLAAMVAEGQFREDLWYRLAVFPIVLPPLRERRDDIPAMARHFAERAAVRFGLATVMPDEHDLRLLQDYGWPGNVRELAAVIDRAAILGDGRRLEVAKSLGVAAISVPVAAGVVAAPAAATAATPGDIVPLNAVVRLHIESALTAAGGRIEGPRGAAKILQINPHTLRAKMRKLGIDWKRFRAAPEP